MFLKWRRVYPAHTQPLTTLCDMGVCVCACVCGPDMSSVSFALWTNTYDHKSRSNSIDTDLRDGKLTTAVGRVALRWRVLSS